MEKPIEQKLLLFQHLEKILFSKNGLIPLIGGLAMAFVALFGVDLTRLDLFPKLLVSAFLFQVLVGLWWYVIDLQISEGTVIKKLGLDGHAKEITASRSLFGRFHAYFPFINLGIFSIFVLLSLGYIWQIKLCTL